MRLALILAILASPLAAQTLSVAPMTLTEWKSVYGLVETRDRVPARARIGGLVLELTVSEGDRVETGQRIALVRDDKLTFQMGAVSAQIDAIGARLATARSDFERGQQLIERGVITNQQFDQLRSAADTLEGELRALEAQRQVIQQQVDEGAVLAPGAGVVLSVPVSLGSVVVPGEALAVIGGGGTYLRLSIPERHAADLSEGDTIELGTGETGRLVKLYPEIAGGRLEADVEVDGLDPRFIGRRVPVRLPVGAHRALAVPEAALGRHGGLDMVTVEGPEGPVSRVVVPGRSFEHDGAAWREILSGLSAGETVVTGDE